MILKRCNGKKVSGILALLVIASVSLAVLAVLLPAVSADTDGTVTTYASVSPGDVRINDTTRVTLAVESVNVTEKCDVDVVLVTDLSGSMDSSNKLNGAKNALKTFVGLGGDEMYIGLASFSNANMKYSIATWAKWLDQRDDDESPFHPYAGFNDQSKTNPRNYHKSAYDSNGYSDAHIDQLFTQNKYDLYWVINGYDANGGTNIAGGINAAKKMLEEEGTPGRLQVIIVMSDGIATMAPIEPDSLDAYMPSDWISDESATGREAAKRASAVVKAKGVIVYAIGFGGSADEDTLRAIASSEGKYYFAPNNDDLAGIYTEISGEIEELGDARAYYVLPGDVEYARNATIVPGEITGNTLRWDMGALAPDNPWTVSFDVRTKTPGEDIPVNVVPGSKVTYGGDASGSGIVTIGGEININPNNSPHNEFWLMNGSTTSIATRDDLMDQYYEGYTGAATHIHVKPKGNGNQNSLIVDGETYPLVNANTYDICSNSMWVELYNDHVNPQGKAVGKWWIAINATDAAIAGSGGGGEVQLPALVVDVGAFSAQNFDINTTPEGAVIGQLVEVTGYAEVSNTVNDANVSVKIYVDCPTMGYTKYTKGHTLCTSTKPIGVTDGDEGEDITVYTTWIPMSSGKHTISIYVYELKDDGTEFWEEAQGNNSKTVYKTIHIKKIR